ncbi:MAG: group III truncated hemoglobin, partial [Bacteroidetes bacterium]|nr:group III truncated hemoglobin [Bacteroidota bacterium]
YGEVLKDENLQPFFVHFNMDEHQPRMVAFWSFLLLDISGYKGNVIEKHLNMPLELEHFDYWVKHFEQTLDTYFTGSKVELAKQKVAVIRWTMESKLGLR